jgi:S-adenosylmethionine hydrolase
MTLVTLTTDFGLSDPFVGIMKGVILGRAPAATIVDVTHGIPPQDVLAGALVLRHALPYFPPGGVHVAVVDPGVGGARRPLCVETATGYLVGPDNGLLSLAAPPAAIRRIVHLTEDRFFLSPRSTTFHGRDIFAPVAAAIAAGTSASVLGVEVPEIHRLDVPSPVEEDGHLRGQVIYVDHFGNLVTNVGIETLPGSSERRWAVRIRDAHIRGIVPSYAAVAPRELVAVVNSWGLVEVAVRDGSARERLGAGVGERVLFEDAG